VGIYEKTCNISETVQDMTKVRETNGKSHARFKFLQKSMTLDDIERPKSTVAEKNVSWSPPEKFE